MSDYLFQSDDILVREKNLFSANIDDDVVMLDESSGNYFGLNPVAGKIWQLLEKPIRLRDLINSLTTHYEVDRLQCEQETASFLNSLNERKLLHITHAEKA